jgi:hypothetical protein
MSSNANAAKTVFLIPNSKELRITGAGKSGYGRKKGSPRRHGGHGVSRRKEVRAKEERKENN